MSTDDHETEQEAEAGMDAMGFERVEPEVDEPDDDKDVYASMKAFEAMAITCPNCANHVQPDEDGDCPKCYEPGIAPAETTAE